MKKTKMNAVLLLMLKTIAEAQGGTDEPVQILSLTQGEDKLGNDLVELHAQGLVDIEGDSVRITQKGLIRLEKSTADAIAQHGKLKTPPIVSEADEPVGETSDGQVVTKLDVASSVVRQQVAKIMKVARPDLYAKYKAVKFEGIAPGDRPPIEQSRKAYQILFDAFLEATYKKSGV